MRTDHIEYVELENVVELNPIHVRGITSFSIEQVARTVARITLNTRSPQTSVSLDITTETKINIVRSTLSPLITIDSHPIMLHFESMLVSGAFNAFITSVPAQLSLQTTMRNFSTAPTGHPMLPFDRKGVPYI
jgi:hypothetical protein